MTNDKKIIQALIYLWTRDAKYETRDSTAVYVIQHLNAVKRNEIDFVYEDEERAEMARKLASVLYEHN